MTIENRNKLEYNAKKMGDGITLKKVALFLVIAMFVALVPSMGFTEDRNTVRLARTIYALAGDEEYSVKLALGTVVMNRVESAWFGKTLGEVLAEKHQFPAGTRYDAESLSAAHAVLSGVRTLGANVVYYQALDASAPLQAVPETTLGGYAFYAMET